MRLRSLDFLPIRLSLTALAICLGLSDIAIARETARVLPKGIRRFRVVGVMTGDVKDTFNENGDLQGLSYSLNRSMSLNDMRNSAGEADKAKIDQLVQTLNGLQAGLGDQLAASGANLFSDMSVKQTVYMPAFEYGVSDKVSVGARIPLVKRSARISFNSQQSSTARSIKEQVGNLNPAVAAGLDSVAGFDTAFFENKMFTSRGYDTPRDFDKTQLGDLEMGVKYNFLKTENSYTTVLFGACVPTGAKSDIKNPFDKGNSKETFGFATQLFHEVNPNGGPLSLGASAKLSMFLPDTKDRVVAKDANESLPSLLPQDGRVQKVRRQRGAQVETEVSAGHKFGRDAWDVWAAAQYAQKAADKYNGPGNLYYDGLGKNSEWNLTSGEVGLGYSTIPAFRKKAFKVPLEVNLLYSKALAGKNTPLSAYARMDFVLYF